MKGYATNEIRKLGSAFKGRAGEIIERMGSLGLEGRHAKSEEPEGKKGRNLAD